MKVATGLDLPLEAVTETFAILAMRRAGKSNAAVVMAEEMYDAGLPWVAIDPKGDWHGVRSSRDGKSPGLAVVVFGGLHGDLPLEDGAGAFIADLVAEKRLTCVLDVSEMSKAGQTRFLVAFAERLLKVNRDPLHLFLEEADEYIPQRVGPDQARVVGAVGKLVRRGGFRGIGTTLISQRSAVVNKDVLTQVGTLIVLRTTSPQDRKAVRDWVETRAGQGEMLESLPSLANGEAWVWSPEFLQTTKRVQFRRRRTFDSGATPKVGEKRIEPTRLADVNLAAIKEAMEDFIERADAQDPVKLQRRIRVLEAELTKARADRPAPEVREIRVEVPVLAEETLDRLEEALQAPGSLLAEVQETLAVHRRWMAGELDAHRTHQQTAGSEVKLAAVPSPARSRRPTASVASSVSASSNGLPPARQRILDALAWYESVGVPVVSKVQLALMADTSPKSSGYANNLGGLRSGGLIDYPSGGTVALTDEGRSKAGGAVSISTSEELHEALFSKLLPAKSRILAVLIDSYPEPVERDRLAELAGTSSTSSGYANNLGALRSLGLIDYPTSGQVVALPVLFLEGR